MNDTAEKIDKARRNFDRVEVCYAVAGFLIAGYLLWELARARKEKSS